MLLNKVLFLATGQTVFLLIYQVLIEYISDGLNGLAVGGIWTAVLFASIWLQSKLVSRFRNRMVYVAA